MEKNHIEQLWAEGNRKLESGINLDFEALYQVQFGKARNAMRRLLLRRIIENAVFLMIIVLLVKFVAANYPVLEFVIAGLTLCVFACIGFVGGLRQIMLINRLDYSGAVISFQAEMEKLKLYSLQTLRLLLLSVPFYFAYLLLGFKVVFGINVFQSADPKWLIINLVLSVILVPLSIWITRQIGYRSKRRWVKSLIRDNGGKEIYDSMEFLTELDNYDKEGREMKHDRI